MVKLIGIFVFMSLTGLLLWGFLEAVWRSVELDGERDHRVERRACRLKNRLVKTLARLNVRTFKRANV